MIPVVFSTDHNFIMPTGVALYSMLESGKESKFDIFILQGDDVNDDDRRSLANITDQFNSKITFLSPGDSFKGSYEIRGISVASYYRLLIPWLIPQYDTIIYLDGDIIVKSDISQMISHINDENCLVYGIRTPGFTLESEYATHINSLGLDPKKYINGGVQIFNSRLMRELNLKEKILSHANNKYLFQDQDIINLVCKDKIGWLPLKYNSSPVLIERNSQALIKTGITTQKDYEEAIKSPVVIHYAGPKPWKTFTHHWYDWWSVYSRSPFYDVEFAHSKATEILHPKYSKTKLLKMLYRKIFK